jgi:hypothetical protein
MSVPFSSFLRQEQLTTIEIQARNLAFDLKGHGATDPGRDVEDWEPNLALAAFGGGNRRFSRFGRRGHRVKFIRFVCLNKSRISRFKAHDAIQGIHPITAGAAIAQPRRSRKPEPSGANSVIAFGHLSMPVDHGADQNNEGSGHQQTAAWLGNLVRSRELYFQRTAGLTVPSERRKLRRIAKVARVQPTRKYHRRLTGKRH